VLLATIPLAALLNLLRIEHLYLVAFLSGIFTVFYDVAEEALLPSLIRRGQLVEGNSKMAAADALLEITGPGVGGGLVQWLTTLLVAGIGLASGFLWVALSPLRKYTH